MTIDSHQEKRGGGKPSHANVYANLMAENQMLRGQVSDERQEKLKWKRQWIALRVKLDRLQNRGAP